MIKTGKCACIFRCWEENSVVIVVPGNKSKYLSAHWIDSVPFMPIIFESSLLE